MSSQKQTKYKHRIAKKHSSKTKEITPSLKAKELQPQSVVEGLRFLVKNLAFGNDEKSLENYLELKKIKKKTKAQKEEEEKLFNKLIMLHGFESGLWVANLSYLQYADTLSKIRQDIIEQHKCKTPLELMLVDRIVATYWRAMKCDTIFNRLVEKKEGGFSFDQLKVNIIKEFNKAMDLASRQLNTNIILLKELKQPKLNIKVNTKSAFVGGQQQFNVNRQNEQKENKIIDPK